MAGRKRQRVLNKAVPINVHRDPEREIAYAGDRYSSACFSGATERARVRQDRFIKLREQRPPEIQLELDESDRERAETVSVLPLDR